jgi:hypothetical protein
MLLSKIFSTWSEIKKLLEIHDMTEYYYSIEECEDVIEQFQCSTNSRTNKITYVEPQNIASVSDGTENALASDTE